MTGYPPVSPQNGNTQPGLEALHRVGMELRVEFGRTRMLVAEILSLTPGSVVKLDRRQGELATLYVEDRAFAEGELVHVAGTEQLAFRLTRILGAENPEHSALSS